MKKNPVVHFEMPVDDKERMMKFYSSVFGWELNQLGADFGNYIIAMTTESDKKGPLKSGAINGGFYEVKEGIKRATSVVISVEDIREAVKKVTEAGGTIVMEPMDMKGVGWLAYFNDTEGNYVGIIQPEEGNQG